MIKSKIYLTLILFFIMPASGHSKSLLEIQEQYLAEAVTNFNSNHQQQCFDHIFHEDELSSKTSCSDIDDIKADDYSFFKIRFEANDPIPSFVQKIVPGLILQSAVKGGFILEIAMPNDNKLFGLWAIVFDDDGNDYGFTHGSSVSIKTTKQDGLRLSLEGVTNLYTKRTGSSIRDDQNKVHSNQFFTNENVIKLLIDTIPKNKTLYYKAGLGWVNLDSQNFKSKLMASGQQMSWHDFITDIDPNFAIIPHNVADGLGSRHGFSLEAFLGIQKNLISSKSSCRIQVYAQGGGEYNSLGGSSFSGQAGATFYFQKPKSKWAMKLGGSLASSIHQYGSTFEGNIHAGIAKGRTTVSFSYYQQYGDLMNHVQYNEKNKEGKIDSTMNITIGYVFGSWKNN